jgi:hypothetical protein
MSEVTKLPKLEQRIYPTTPFQGTGSGSFHPPYSSIYPSVITNFIFIYLLCRAPPAVNLYTHQTQFLYTKTTEFVAADYSLSVIPSFYLLSVTEEAKPRRHRRNVVRSRDPGGT